MQSKRTPWEIQKSVVQALILRELKTRFGVHRLGAVWLFLEPAAHIAVLLVVFVYIRHFAPPGVPTTIFLLTGIVPFLLFKNIALRIMEAVQGNRGLFGYRVIKPMDTFIARLLLEVLLYTVVFVFLLGGLWWWGVPVELYRPLEFFTVVTLLSLMGFGLGILFCVVGEALPEVKPFIRILFLPLYLLSGILFPVSRLPAEYHDLLLWNPVLHAVELSREAFFRGYASVSGVSLVFVAEVTVVLLFAGIVAYRLRRLELVAQ